MLIVHPFLVVGLFSRKKKVDNATQGQPLDRTSGRSNHVSAYSSPSATPVANSRVHRPYDLSSYEEVSSVRQDKLSNASSYSNSNEFRSEPSHANFDATPTDRNSHRNTFSHLAAATNTHSSKRFSSSPHTKTMNQRPNVFPSHSSPNQDFHRTPQSDVGIGYTVPPLQYSPMSTPPVSFNRYGSTASSTLSLPLQRPIENEFEQETLEKDSNLLESNSQAEGEKRSRWKFPGKSKRRTASVSSAISFGTVKTPTPAAGAAEEQEGGFFVRSFRTVSRVQDPITTGPYETLPAHNKPPNSPPLPAVPLVSSLFNLPNLDQKNSPAASTPTSPSQLSVSSPRRPSAGTRSPGSGSWTNLHERAPSPTMTVEQFRFASARSRSTTSLSTISNLGATTHEREAFAERPRFEPSQSRRSSFNTNSPQIQLSPPRPNFAAQKSSPSHTRESSYATTESHGYPMTSSKSTNSVASFATAPEQIEERVSAHSAKSSRSNLNLSRADSATSDTELKFIKMYSDSPATTPAVESKFINLPFENKRLSLGLNDFQPAPSTPNKTGPSAPAVAIQPPTPVTNPYFAAAAASPTTSRFTPSVARNRQVSSHTVNVSSQTKNSAAVKGKEKAGETDSDAQSSSDDDDIPLATIQSRSQLDLSLSSVHSAVPVSPLKAQQIRPKSPEMEVLAGSGKFSPASDNDKENSKHVPSNAPGVTFPAMSSVQKKAPAFPSNFPRRNSQRRSISTLSISAPKSILSSNLAPTNSSTQNLISSVEMSNTPASNSTLPSLENSSNSSGQRKDFDSSSGSGSGSSVPRTPQSNSPNVSDLGMTKLPPAQSDVPSPTRSSVQVKFADSTPAHAAQSTAAGRKVAQRMSLQSQQAGKNLTSAMKSKSATNLPELNSKSSLPKINASEHNSKKAAAQARANISSTGGVFDRMKARHRAETSQAIKLGRELNGPEIAARGLNSELGENSSDDDDEPLSSLPRNNSQMGSMYAGFAPSFSAQTSFGGYSALSVAPTGVDPFLYNSLPNDQKLQLHQRSQEMLRKLHQHALQAKAESVIGYNPAEDAAAAHSENSSRSGTPTFHRSAQSLSNLQNFNPHAQQQQQIYAQSSQESMHAMYAANQGMNPYAYAQPPPASMYQPNRYSALPMGGKLPPFAPSLAMSQQFLQQSPSMNSMYAYNNFNYGLSGMPAMGYGGGSMIGLPSQQFGGSSMGINSLQGRGGRRVASSVIGTGGR